MKRKSAHESKAKVMSAAEVWDDAQQIAAVLRQNLLKAEPVVRLPIPLSVFLSALDDFSREELVILHKHVEERLAV
jgi:hypothetical protein